MRRQILLNAFLKATETMDIEPLELDRFFHEGFYQSMGTLEQNLDQLELWRSTQRQG